MNRASIEALTRLRQFAVQPSVWDKVPWARRAGVLVILYGNKYGDLSTILTMRSKDMTSFAGHAALPGGKVDNVDEDPYQAARRETHEEIGIPNDDEALALKGYKLEHLTTLPAYLSRNLLAVRPSIAYLSSTNPGRDHMTDMPSIVDLASVTSPEVREVFSAPLKKFLSANTGWYTGKDANWGGLEWNQHWFKTIRKRKEVGENGWNNLWGMTANMVVDTARIAYDQEPQMVHRKPNHFGDEALIAALHEKGKLGSDRSQDEAINFVELFGEDSPLLKTRQA